MIINKYLNGFVSNTQYKILHATKINGIKLNKCYYSDCL